LNRHRDFAIAVLTAFVGASCTSTPPLPSPPTSVPGRSSAITATPPPSAPPSPGPTADTLRVALPAGGEPNAPFGPLSNATSSVGDDYEKAAVIDVFIHDALYRYDERLRPVPSLASSCDPGSDGLTITCHLAAASFQNGDPVTADDVVFTYRLMAATTHVESEFAARDCVTDVTGCLSDVLESVTKVDDRTVTFLLKRQYTPFFTLVLPAIWIDSEKVIRASYERLQSKLSTVAGSDLSDEAQTLSSTIDSPAPNCLPVLQPAVDLATRAGLFVPDRAEYNYFPGAEFDACSYAITLSLELAQAAGSLAASDEITKIAFVYPALDIDRAPVGAGPYQLSSYVPGQRVELAAFAGFHGGPAATPKVVFDIYLDDDATAKAVARGADDWLEDFYDAAAFRQLVDLPSLRFGHPANPFYASIVYNSRSGQLFSDVRLRQAVSRCIEKPAAVAAATEGRGVPAYADVAPGTWAFDDALPKPTRDVGAGKALIEAAGWKLGADGVYAKAGNPLAATIYVRSDASDRLKMAQLISGEVRDCGINLSLSQSDFDGDLRGILQPPHLGPGTDAPFDMYLLIWGNGWDPLSHLFDPAAIPSADQPGDNFGGYSNPQVGDLLSQVQSSYDIDTRAGFYRQYQEILADQQPALFLWHQARLDAASTGLRTIDGPLDLNLAHWFAFPERLVRDISH
jgi:ABC-type transport system substrate-binding protein